MKPAFTSVGVLALVAFTASAQQDFSKVEIKATHIAGSVHMLEGRGGNIGVSVGPDGVLIVDDQFLPLAEKVEAAVQKLDKGPLKFVLNTHWHGDHSGGNPYFGKKGIIVAHSNVRVRLANAEGKPAPKEALPVVTFDQSSSIHFNGEEIRLWHVGPGHTDGDVIIHFTKSGVIHTGDSFLTGRFPFIDFSSGGDVEGFMRTIADVLAKCPDDAKIIPGHGVLATKADLRAYDEMLRESSGLVKQAIAAGKTAEQIRAAGLAEKWKSWGSGFINTGRWLDTLYNGLSKK